MITLEMWLIAFIGFVGAFVGYVNARKRWQIYLGLVLSQLLGALIVFKVISLIFGGTF